MGKPSRRWEADNTRDVSDSTPPEQEVVRKFFSEEEITPKEPTLQDVMQAITASRTALEEKIDSLASDFSVLRDDHRRLAERVTSAEKQLKELGPEIEGASKISRQMEKIIKDLELRAEDAENRLRQNNIRIMGLPEKVEGTSMVDFLEKWLKENIAEEGLSQFFAVERAHRVPARPSPLGVPARPVIAKLLHYKDRDHLLTQSRKKGDCTLDNQVI
ncbi:hypothetical protein NDU88_000288 [Pleurodeles waltl]|uniref:LINE-1 type transposase domain-containing 1 n=1 Tax=Pleurodeles waltl TaxID=8319 RepID=A0AAV7UQW1_PLEWA|nr:hypothetical protein NDU88_000288 [Pleurodeles waltl]